MPDPLATCANSGDEETEGGETFTDCQSEGAPATNRGDMRSRGDRVSEIANSQRRHSMSGALPNGWHHMQDINLRNELILNISPLEDVPISIRNDFKR